MLLRRIRPLLLCAVVFAGLWAFAVYARTESVRVVAVRGLTSKDTYTVTCQINNPSDNDVHVIAAVSVLASKGNTEGEVYVSLAKAERELIIPANGEYPLRVDFVRNWGWLQLVHPQVIVRPANKGH